MRTRAALLAVFGATATVAACTTTATLPFGTPTGTPTATPSAIPSSAASPIPTVITGNVVLNSCFSANASNFSATLKGGAGVASSLGGHLLLLLQVTDDSSPRASGDQNPVTTASELGLAGRWDLMAVTTVTTANGDAVANLASQVSLPYQTTPTRAAEACVVPSFTTFTVNAGAQVRATTWNGTSGGVIALVAETADIEGTVVADAAGFTGGDHSILTSGTFTCDVTTLDSSDGHDAGMKGGGNDGRGYLAYGAGNSLQGGGGGNGGYEGGAGGANGGAGGSGGAQADSCAGNTTVFAHGGAPIALAPQTRLAFGGGGGGGYIGKFSTGASVAGGAGGGIIMISAHAFRGSASGLLSANGRNAIAPVTGSVGQAGGGAGGTIWIRDTTTWSFAGTVNATGGAGGNAGNNGSPGGGGSGGRVQLPGTPGLLNLAGGGAGTGGVGGAQAGAVGAPF